MQKVVRVESFKTNPIGQSEIAEGAVGAVTKDDLQPSDEQSDFKSDDQPENVDNHMSTESVNEDRNREVSNAERASEMEVKENDNIRIVVPKKP